MTIRKAGIDGFLLHIHRRSFARVDVFGNIFITANPGNLAVGDSHRTVDRRLLIKRVDLGVAVNSCRFGLRGLGRDAAAVLQLVAFVASCTHDK